MFQTARSLVTRGACAVALALLLSGVTNAAENDNAYDPALIGKLDAFARRHIPSSARQNVRNVTSNIRYNADIRSKRLPEVVAWIEHRSPRA